MPRSPSPWRRRYPAAVSTASPDTVTADFFAHWQAADGTELANYQLFLHQLAELLGVDQPQPSRGDTRDNAYVFERRVRLARGDGTAGEGRIDCYRRGCFVLEAKKLRAAAATRGVDDALLRARAQEEQQREAAAHVSSPEFRQKLKDAIAQGKVIDVLLDVAANEQRADGWTLFTKAQNRVHERLPKEARSLKERLGREWLFKTMAIASESFEARTEPMPNGAAGTTRIVNRMLSEP